ncbi:HTH_Tnp_Tc3_2 domain-containing protein [Trichonephila clavipes]|nr:HTH_Tnp_Tc3_2 domain-containing protein [Trichonephila clavipes]
MESEGSANQVARQLGLFDCVVRRCWDQWIRDMSFTRRPGSGQPRQTSRQEDRHIVRISRTANCFISRHPGTGSTFNKVPLSSRTVRMTMSEGYTCAAFFAYPSTPLFGVVPCTRNLDCSGMEPGRI